MEPIRDDFTAISNVSGLPASSAARCASLSMVQAAKYDVGHRRRYPQIKRLCEGVAMMEGLDIFQNQPHDEVKQQYGALPWRKGPRGRLQVLLITSRRRGRWIVPKGWPMKDRQPCLVAAMEAFEEAGVIGEVEPSPLGRYDYMKEGSDGSSQRVCVTLFGLAVVGTLTNWPERGQRKRRWFGLAEAAETVDDLSLIPLISAIRDAPQILFDKPTSRSIPVPHMGDAAAT